MRYAIFGIDPPTCSTANKARNMRSSTSRNYKNNHYNSVFYRTSQVSSSHLDWIRKEKKNRGLRLLLFAKKAPNGEREMAYALYLAGFDVKDVHMTDLISGRETLEDVQFAVFVAVFQIRMYSDRLKVGPVVFCITRRQTKR